MRHTSTNPFALAMAGWQLGWDMSQVVWLRSLRMMAGGPIAEREGRRMIGEKVEAALTFWPALWWQGAFLSPEAFGAKAIQHYARPVRANRRRLSRGNAGVAPRIGG